ncbi:hypothetical protein M501DRAFT_532321 [Patellaria atrata CBS 101060]|uniref:Uncharacterized protein n=1 Tax=Patellaria atrata CBS 101060 TaxID=1346257 RepID=A0A9P4VT91_9PEZI|nr:hypothetical protein M501DRAFT_532321 [Patellaria atrata CBS 101060]
MATQFPARQPFGSLDSSRLQALSSIKNRQNARSALEKSTKSFPSFAPEKQTLVSPFKRRYSPDNYGDLDSENIDPSIFNSPTKRSKNIDGTPLRKSSFILTDTPKSQPKPISSLTSRLEAASQRKTLSSPPTSVPTPIFSSRGSPKHKRVGLLSKRKSAGGSPFRRIDPPSFMRGTTNGTTGLPFSIDAALSGTISSYTPKSTPVEKEVKILEDSMPKGWFFDIHEDTPEQEATNMMEHSALQLDISSDDDCITKRKNEERERGKENIPPPEWVAMSNPSRSPRMNADLVSSSGDALPESKSLKRRHSDIDAMVEDRSPLGNLNTEDFYPEGLDASSTVIVDGDKSTSGLSQESNFNFEVPAALNQGESIIDVTETLAAVDEQVQSIISAVEVPVVQEEIKDDLIEEIPIWTDADSTLETAKAEEVVVKSVLSEKVDAIIAVEVVEENMIL